MMSNLVSLVSTAAGSRMRHAGERQPSGPVVPVEPVEPVEPAAPAEPVVLAQGHGLRPKVLLRALLPMFVVRLWYALRHGAVISPRAEVDLSRQVRLGRRVCISAFVKLKIDGPLVLGDGVQIASGTFMAVQAGGMRLGDHVMIGPNCTIVSSNYVFDRLELPLQEQGFTSRGVTIGERTWIGANSVVLDGARIGRNVIVAAGSVVAGEVPDDAIVQGNPAAVIFRRR